MRRISLLIGGAVIALAACSGEKKTASSNDLQKDLELASTSEGLGVAPGANSSIQVVSSIERTTPGPKAPALSSKARHYHRAPTHTVAPVETEAPAVVSEPEPTPVADEPVAVDPTPVSPRPTPQTVSYPGGNTGTVRRGSNTGSVLGAILGAVVVGAVMSGHGSVMRGGVVIGGGDGDTCDPRTDGRRRRDNGGYINQRIPRIGNIPIGTFPR